MIVVNLLSQVSTGRESREVFNIFSFMGIKIGSFSI